MHCTSQTRKRNLNFNGGKYNDINKNLREHFFPLVAYESWRTSRSNQNDLWTFEHAHLPEMTCGHLSRSYTCGSFLSTWLPHAALKHARHAHNTCAQVDAPWGAHRSRLMRVWSKGSAQHTIWRAAILIVASWGNVDALIILMKEGLIWNPEL